MKKFNFLILLILSLAFISCSRTEEPTPDPDPAEPIKISEEGIKFVGQATDGALITLQIYDNKLKLLLDNAGMYPDGSLDGLSPSCLSTAKFSLVINGTTVNGQSIDISCPVPNTPPTDEERLDFSFYWTDETNNALPSEDFNHELLCNAGTGAGLQYAVLKDLTELPVLNDSIRYCLGTDNKTYRVIVNKLAGLGLYFPTRFNFLNRTINGVISIIDTNNEALDLIIKEI